MLQSKKEHQYLVFYFDDGKNVKYNLATGETIGKLGKPVKDICTQLRGCNLLNVIESFEDERYRDFLKFIDENFINISTANKYKPYSRNSRRVNKISNIGSFLSRIYEYKHFEQYFACGIKLLDRRIRYKLNEIPKNLIKLCKIYSIRLDNQLIVNYKKNPNLFTTLLNQNFSTITRTEILNILCDTSYYNGKFNELLRIHNYKPLSLIQYIDNLMTYEALSGFNFTICELLDYCNMMNKISPKYEKYPKNFLTTHKIATRNYNRLKEQFIEADFKKVRDLSFEYTYNNYKVIYPQTTQDIKDEAVQQNHCVASYIQNVIDGKTHILFLREKDNIEKSLITLEVKNYRVVQARGKFNRDATSEEQFIINMYNKKLNKIKNNLIKESEKTAC